MENWIKKQRELLELESQSEAAQLLEKIHSLPSKLCEQEGLSICNLEVASTKTELFGRCCVEFQKIGKQSMPSGFKVGDEVTIISSEQNSDSDDDGEDTKELNGLVKKCSNFSIEIIFDEYERRLAYPPLRLNLKPSLTTHKRMMNALQQLQSTPHPLFSLVHSPEDFSIHKSFLYFDNEKVSKWNNCQLNESQKEAIECCLNSSLVSIIHGPPGTGKTATLAELILQQLERNRKILVCAPSNIAVDTILQRVAQLLESIEVGKSNGLSKYRDRIVRIGHPARISTSILQFTLDHHIENDDGTQIVRDIHEEIQNLRSQLQRKFSKKSKSSVSKSFKEMRSELKQIRKEANQREKSVVQQILSNAQIVFSTCVGAATSLIREMEFDVTIIDEAAQGIEAACWIPIMRSRKVVLAGDHCQLPPTIKSAVAAQGGLQITLFERIITNLHFQSFCKLLKIQYRMNDIINQWASNQMYEGQLISDSSVANHTIEDIVSADQNKTTLPPVALMIDTSGEYMYEEELSSENGKSSHASHRNVHEAYLTLQHCLYLMNLGVSPESIGVITPYNGQLEILKQLFELYGNIHNMNRMSLVELKTIDGFQGGEKECILISFVRSNEKRNVGFLSERRRMNVAVTRAKRHLAIIGDSSTCGCDDFIHSLINHVEQFGEIIPPSAYSEYYFPPISENLINIPRSINTNSTKNNNKTLISKNEKAGVSKTSSRAINVPNNGSVKTGISHVTNPRIFPPKPVVEDNDERREQLKTILQLYKERKLVGGNINMNANSGKVYYEHSHLFLNEYNSSEITLPLKFPVGLNSFERMLVHELAGIVGLQHKSQDFDSNHRFIEVSHPPTNDDNAIGPIISNIPVDLKDQDVSVLNAQVNNIEINVTALVSPEKQNHHNNSKQRKIPPKPSQPSLPSSLDEDALLELAIRQNQELASFRKYRIGSSPLLNPEKEASKNKLKSKLHEAQDARRAAVPTPNNESSTNSNRKKVIKKPVPNFGGGKVGTKDKD